MDAQSVIRFPHRSIVYSNEPVPVRFACYANCEASKVRSIAARDPVERPMLEVVERVTGLPHRVGGEEHSGWLPPSAARPLPTPVRDVLLDVEIQFDGFGYLLCYVSRDGAVYGDTWHESLADARLAAAEKFGIIESLWQPA